MVILPYYRIIITMAVLNGFYASPIVKFETAPVTGSTTTVLSSEPFNQLVFTNGATTAAQTVVLPGTPADGQVFTVSNPAAAITALTFSPVVKGWTGGATLAASTGLVLQWSTPLGVWFVANQ